MAELFAGLLLVLFLAFWFAIIACGALILFSLVYGIVMLFVGWLRH